MKEISLPFFYQFGSELRKLTRLENKPESRLDFVLASMNTRESIMRLFVDFPSLEVCRTRGDQLIDAMQKVLNWWRKTTDEKDDTKRAEIWKREDWETNYIFMNVSNISKEFETVLLAEMEKLPVYHPEEKGNYSTRRMINRAESTLPKSVLNKISFEAKREINECGRCFVFDTPTACGFHIMRATEVVMHDFYLQVCKPKLRPEGTLDNWGAYIKAFRESPEPSAKQVAELLQQIKDLNRNPIMHPEVFLNDDQAFELFELAKSAIIIMAKELNPDSKNDISKKPHNQDTTISPVTLSS